MNLTPVIVRELRSESRNPVNYWIRVIAALLLLLPLALYGVAANVTPTTNGEDSFVLLTIILFFSAWVIIPVTVSDCISQERRDGTLGLLFLTPLNAREILLGKSAVNIVRSLLVFFATLPILTVPLLMGGITAGDILRAAFFNGSALALSLAAALLGSTLSKQRNRALVLSLLLSGFFLLFVFLWPLSHLVNSPLGPNMLTGVGSGTITDVAAGMLLLSVGILVAVIFVCAARLQRSWQDKPLTAKQQAVYNTFCSPRFLLSFFKTWKQKKLTRNPVGWLQRYSWSSRLSTWGWCGVIISVESYLVLTSDVYYSFGGWQSILQHAFFISMAFSAVSSFQRERQTGALELILVTSIREGELISGRLRGIWAQFLPAFLVLFFSTWYMQDIYSFRNVWGQRGSGFSWFWSMWQFFSIPIVGLYLGLRFRSLLGAWFLTCAGCLLLPASMRFAMALARFVSSEHQTIVSWTWLFTGVFLFVLPIFAWRRTERNLRDRSFVVNTQ